MRTPERPPERAAEDGPTEDGTAAPVGVLPRRSWRAGHLVRDADWDRRPRRVPRP